MAIFSCSGFKFRGVSCWSLPQFPVRNAVSQLAVLNDGQECHQVSLRSEYKCSDPKLEGASSGIEATFQLLSTRVSFSRSAI